MRIVKYLIGGIAVFLSSSSLSAADRSLDAKCGPGPFLCEGPGVGQPPTPSSRIGSFHPVGRIPAFDRWEAIEDYVIYQDRQDRTVFQGGAQKNDWLRDAKTSFNLPENMLYRVEPSQAEKFGLPSNTDVYIYTACGPGPFLCDGPGNPQSPPRPPNCGPGPFSCEGPGVGQPPTPRIGSFHPVGRIPAFDRSDGIEDYVIYQDRQDRTVFQGGAQKNDWLRDAKTSFNLPKNMLYRVEPSQAEKFGLPPNTDVYIYVK